MIGTILGHYRVVRKFSGGGLGIVCAADLRLGLCAALEFIQNISGAGRKAGFSTPATLEMTVGNWKMSAGN